MKHFEYTPNNVCSKKMIFDIDESTNTIVTFKIIGGCSGNTQGISKLIIGRNVDEIINLLEGTICMGRGTTSCPDQVAKALKQAKGN